MFVSTYTIPKVPHDVLFSSCNAEGTAKPLEAIRQTRLQTAKQTSVAWLSLHLEYESGLFQDDEVEVARWLRDPVAQAQPSQTVQQKKKTKKTQDGWPVHSYQTLLTELATRCKNTCRVGEGKNVAHFTQLTELTPFQCYVYQLLGLKC